MGGYIHGRENRSVWMKASEEAKNYRHKIFGRTKKVVTGQSQIAFFVCFKSILAYPHFGHMRKMLLNVA